MGRLRDLQRLEQRHSEPVRLHAGRLAFLHLRAEWLADLRRHRRGGLYRDGAGQPDRPREREIRCALSGHGAGRHGRPGREVSGSGSRHRRDLLVRGADLFRLHRRGAAPHLAFRRRRRRDPPRHDDGGVDLLPDRLRVPGRAVHDGHRVGRPFPQLGRTLRLHRDDRAARGDLVAGGRRAAHRGRQHLPGAG